MGLLCCFLLWTGCTRAQINTRVVYEGLFIPWELIYGPDDHIWFTQKNGYICRLEPVSGILDTLYHESNTVIQQEGGMLGMALHPDFPIQPYIYVAYNYHQGSYKQRIVRYTWSGTALYAPQILLDGIHAASIHNGCRLLIVDDKLFITTGDAANQPAAQDITALNGKILRINLDGTIPADNPLPGNPVWSWGHRNAQGLTYFGGKLYSTEHGPTTDDELNNIVAGRNYGWPAVHGYCNTPAEISFCNDSNVVEPVITWTPTLAVSAIAYYAHPMFPDLQHSLLMTTLKNQHLYQLKLNAAADSITQVSVVSAVNAGRLRAICVAPDGRIFIATSNAAASGNGAYIDKIIELYNPALSLLPDKRRSNKIALYPNPAGESVRVAWPVAGKEAIMYIITDATGRRLLRGSFSGKSGDISLASLAPGMYYMRMENAQGQVAIRPLLKKP